MKFDYRKFMNEVVDWIEAQEAAAQRFGFGSEQYFDWVFKTSGQLCDKYENHPFALRQMRMVYEHIDEAAKQMKRSDAHEQY